MTAPRPQRKPRAANRQQVLSKNSLPIAGTARAVYLDDGSRAGFIQPRGPEWLALENRGAPISAHDTIDAVMRHAAQAEERGR
jgi:hypothetical protein